ncbi:uncharacterized protein LOC115046433 isoform X6 [Echeneis naucrates]|uniref:uncharacterized protein LOC115046433 isoform X6 n=1 Tax=Echeneis naucrates TaxID=173247 RepID=UPI001113B821|nr:uncharacterized protein LOC115046433 isoform X6 [Echeneis naucrates]
MATLNANPFDEDRPVSPAFSNVSMKSGTSKIEPVNFHKEDSSPFDEDRPVSPASSNVSMKSSTSKIEPVNFHKEDPNPFDEDRPVSPASSNVSMKSSTSKIEPVNFHKEDPNPFDEDRPVSPASSNVSMKSSTSKIEPVNFHKEDPSPFDEDRPVSPAFSNVSMKSGTSKIEPVNFHKEDSSPFDEDRPVSPASSNVSMKSSTSKIEPVNFHKEDPSPFDEDRPVSPAFSNVSMKSGTSKIEPVNFHKEDSSPFDEDRPVSPASSNVSMKSSTSKIEPVNFHKEDPNPFDEDRPVSPASSNVSMKSSTSKIEPVNFHKEDSSPFDEDRPVSPASSNVSMKSSTSKIEPVNFHKEDPSPFDEDRPVSPAFSNVSMKSGTSKIEPVNFHKEDSSPFDEDRPVSPASSNVSMKSSTSKIEPVNFHKEDPNPFDEDRPVSPASSNVSMKSSMSKIEPVNFHKEDPSPFDEDRPVSPAFSNVSMKSGTSKIEPVNFHEDPRSMLSCSPKNRTSEYDVLDFTAGLGPNKNTTTDDTKHKLEVHLRDKILKDYEDELSRHEPDTELYKIQAGKNKEDELMYKCIKSYNDIFKTSSQTKVHAVLLKGVANVGKSFQAKKLMVDWAKGKSNKNIDLMIPFNFRELNSKRDQNQSMEDLLNHFFHNLKLQTSTTNGPTYDKYKLAFVLDGLEECELKLDFENNKDLSDIKDRASLDVLLTNLIKGKLLPSAQLCIISQPSGVNKIPPQYFQRVTECQETLVRRQKLVQNLGTRLRTERVNQVEDTNHPNQQNTEHIIRSMHTEEVNDEENNGQTAQKPVKKVNKISEIFKGEKGKTIRAVLTTGEANIGKSFHVKEFIKQWASAVSSIIHFVTKSEKEKQILFPLSSSELNSIKTEKVSLIGLLNRFFKETKECVISNYARFKVVFVLDGLDSFEFHLDFDKSDVVKDVREPVSLDVLLTNLIKGNLLPSAKVWITSRPSSLEWLPDSSFDRTTEIREKPDVASQRKLKAHLKKQFLFVSEGIDKEKTAASLKEIYTDLYIIEGERGEVNVQHESRQIHLAKFKPTKEEKPIKYNSILEPAHGQNPIKTVLTIGVAGIGKTFASMKYVLDWAEDTDNKKIHFTFPLPFRELNLRKDAEHSFEELLQQFFPFMKKSEITNYDQYKILIVLDGLDECRLDLNFGECQKWTDVRKKTSVNVLLTNLIQGNLLPKAQIWITSRPAASNNIPADKVDRVTEVRGFNDKQKDEYFRRRFSDKDLAEKILSHVKKSRSLHIMCHIPVFCWITSKVLEDLLSHPNKTEEGKKEGQDKIPKTLTDMYIHFLLLQCRQANVKYGQGDISEDSDSCWSTRNKETVLSLGKLAFEELEKGNLLFTEENLIECEIDIENTAVFSGLFTQVIQENSTLYPEKFFCFVHLSIQEFLAAFYVSHMFNNEGENLLVDSDESDLYTTAVDKALSSKHGDWDLFLRFLLGLSVETNQNLLQGVTEKTENTEATNKETIKYIKEKISEGKSDPEKNLNLFHCLNELNDHSLVEEVKKYLQSDTQEFDSFSTSQWSALNYVLLMSDEKLDVFDLKMYLKSEKVLLGMLPVVKVSKTTLLSWCELSEESCRGLTSSVLTHPSSNLTQLDLSHNDLLDSGVEHLAEGLKSVHCKLEILKLSGCQVTEKGCSALASALEYSGASHLKHLDLSYNHPGDDGLKRLCAITQKMKLQTLCLDHAGEHRLKPGLRKYGAVLTFDEKTISRRLVCEGTRKIKTVVKVEEKVGRSENKDRFKRTQVFCAEDLGSICYWGVEWKGTVGIAVSYEEVGRKWDRSGGLGCNDMSWTLLCSKSGYTAMHGKNSKNIQMAPCQKIAVFLDKKGGSLSYYSVESEKLSLIHVFKAKFTKPLFAGFWFKKGSVSLCEIDSMPLSRPGNR